MQQTNLYCSFRKKYLSHYCSIKCRSEDPEYRNQITNPRIKGKSIKCDFCGTEIFKHLYQLKKDKKHYCSQKCSANNNIGQISKKRNGKMVLCSYCKKEVYRASWRLKNSKCFFCSVNCMNKYTTQFLVRPTKPEKLLIELIKKYDLPYKYVGDGKLWIGNVNPDFIHLTKSKVIEIFGDYWHNPKLNRYCKEKNTEDGRKEIFQREKYGCLIIWEKEFKNKNWETEILERIIKWES